MVQPIWKKFYVSLGTSDFAEYAIRYDTGYEYVTIYNGKAWKKPGEQEIKICINDICADWLINVFPSLSEENEAFVREMMPIEFNVQKISAAGVYDEVAKVRFVKDWSYDEKHNVETDGFSAPINNKVDARQWVLWTGLDELSIYVYVTEANGQISVKKLPIKIFSDFEEDFNQDFAKSLGTAGSGTAVFQPMQFGDVTKMSIERLDYEVTDCSRYVLYYLNAYGGWDSLLIEGATSEEDNLTRHTMSIAGEKGSRNVNYLNDIQKKLTLHTSWLSDEQSLRMHHLLNSTDVYLHDLENDVIHPVVLNNTATPYKTYKGEGGKVVSYSIEASMAYHRMRR